MNNLIEYFENTVQHFPDKTAVACKDEGYTFSKLRQLSRQLGEVLVRAYSQSGPDEAAGKPRPVGVFVNRGIETAAFFLAVLYSGNFYVPIDPDMPQEKIAAILADADPQVVLCAEENKSILRDIGFQGQIFTIADAEQPKEAGAIDPDSFLLSVSADTPAYMIYTSGSTGQPKGVLKSHGAVIDFMETFLRLFGLGADEIIGNQTPFFFDASAKDFYLMIFTGATLEILPSELFVFPVTLIEYMNQRNISYICWVPTALSVVTQLNTFQQILPTTLKKVFFVGETFPARQLRKWMETLPDLQYVNLYGSTEIAGVCCYYELPVPFGETEEIPIGRPLPNCRVFLLEEDGTKRFLTEPDTVGEIYVTSSTLALEYFHDPKRTAETFVTLALPDGTEGRALKTGDLARYDASGNLIFVSRTDDQIKHTGHRIELGEIESVVYQIPEIQKCCCLYNEKKGQICLFCELVPGCDWDARTIRRMLSERLSDYMQPSKCYILDKIPLNANGKADRVKLKEML